MGEKGLLHLEILGRILRKALKGQRCGWYLLTGERESYTSTEKISYVRGKFWYVTEFWLRKNQTTPKYEELRLRNVPFLFT